MLSKPRDLDSNDLLAALAHWGLAGVELEYLPVGFGSHHWCADDGRGMRRFVTVDDLEAGFQAGPDTDSAFEALERAYRTAALLRRETDLEFVVAPLADDEGRVLRRVSDRYAVTVLPLVEGESGAFGPYESPDQRERVAVVLGRLHAATGAVPSDLPRRDDFALPSRAELEDAFRRVDRPWSSGPFGEPARALLRANAASVGRHGRHGGIVGKPHRQPVYARVTARYARPASSGRRSRPTTSRGARGAAERGLAASSPG